MREKIILIIKLGRLHFLFPGFLLFLWGYLLATYSELIFDWSKFFLGYFAFSLAHLSISFSNNYFDRFSDKNSIKTSFSGGSSILVNHPELSRLTLHIGVFLLVFSAIIMIIFATIYSYSYWFILYGIFGGLIGYFYSAPPLKFSYRGLGELVSIISIGFLIPGMGSLVASGVLDQSLFLFIFPLSCYGLFFILTVEMPDLESDQITKKDNIIVRRGRKIGYALILFSTSLATFSILILEISGLLLIYFPFGLLTIISIVPLIASILGLMRSSNERKELNNLVKLNMTSIISFIFIADLLLLSKLFL